MNELTHERLLECLSYEPDTGVFTWIKRISIRIMVGWRAGVPGKHGHRYIRIDNKRYPEHRLAWFYVYGAWPTKDIDHIDGDPAANRIKNLREATAAENGQNRGKQCNNTSGFKGVVWHRGGHKWMAQIWARREKHYLGLFDDPREAHAVYAAKALELHGKFARTE